MRRRSSQARRSWLSLIFALTACKEQRAEPLPTPAETRALADELCPQVARPLFFKIERDGLTSYVLGTRHVGVRFAKFPPEVEVAFRASKIAVFESIASAPDKPAALDRELGPARWAKLRALVGPIEAERVRNSPAKAIAMLLTLFEDRSAFLDVELQELARTRQMELVALEDNKHGDHRAQELASPERLRKLLDSISGRETLKAATESGLRSYCTAGSAQPGDPSELDEVSEQRRRAWLTPLAMQLQRGQVFVAVGAAHLAGPDGLPALLREQGFMVTDLSQ
ncbi:MAG TPA: TraB/GumN family protein [Kofleriaceae bacterium]